MIRTEQGKSTSKGFIPKPYHADTASEAEKAASADSVIHGLKKLDKTNNEYKVTKTGCYICRLSCISTAKGEHYTSIVLVDDLIQGTVGTRVTTVTGETPRTIWVEYKPTGTLECFDNSGYADVSFIESVTYIEM